MLEFLRDIFTSINVWLGDLLGDTLNLPPSAVVGIKNLVGVIVVASFALLIVIFTIWLERKIVGRIQDRLGPNRVGPFGLLQSVADALKMLTKEVITPEGADRVVYLIAPLLMVVSVILIWAVVPFARTAIGTDLSIGALYFVAVSGLGTLAVIMAGWSSNNKYSLLGAFRAVAQLVSYEVPLILALLVPVMLAGTMRMNEIVRAQSVWYIFMVPIPALIFFISNMAETGRSPFDLLEAESEIVAGFHIEYTGMVFGLFMLGEFLHSFTASALIATLFLGGWRGPGAADIPTLGLLYFFAKTFFVYFVVMWVRFTVPRVRIDQLMDFAWKFLIPISLAALVVIPLVDKIAVEIGMYSVPTLAELADMTVLQSIQANLTRTVVLFVTNLLLGMVVLGVLGRTARRQRLALDAEVDEESAADAVPAGAGAGD
jgi:NADH-quinone oxidoreductase subunit H